MNKLIKCLKAPFKWYFLIMMIPIHFILWIIYKACNAMSWLGVFAPFLIGLGWLIFMLSPYTASGMHWLYLIVVWMISTALSVFAFYSISLVFMFVEDGLRDRFES